MEKLKLIVRQEEYCKKEHNYLKNKTKRILTGVDNSVCNSMETQ